MVHLFANPILELQKNTTCFECTVLQRQGTQAKSSTHTSTMSDTSGSTLTSADEDGRLMKLFLNQVGGALDLLDIKHL